jgi:hypothetical protein
MRPRPRSTLAAILALLQAACTPEADPAAVAPPEPAAPASVPSAAPVVGYACDGGGVASVQYIDAATARLFYRGASHELRLAPSPRGARWIGETLEWQTTQADGLDQATLSKIEPDPVGATVIDRCRRPVQGGTPASTPVPDPSAAIGAGVPACRGPQLTLSAQGSDAGAGGRGVTLSLSNVGTRVCSLTGHPGLALIDGAGKRLADVRADQVVDAAGRPPEVVVLQPGGKAWFDVRWTVVPDQTQGERPCPAVARLRVTAPGDTSPVSLDQAMAPCNGRVRITTVRAAQDPDAAAATATPLPAG